MPILDAYAVLALLRGEPAAEQVRHLMVASEPARLTCIGVAEVLDRLVRLTEVDEDEAVLDLAQLELSDPGPLDATTALRAGLLRSRHYHRKNCAVSLADCIAAETARLQDQTLVTSDPHLLDMCTAEGIPVTVLPDSSGISWTPSG